MNLIFYTFDTYIKLIEAFKELKFILQFVNFDNKILWGNFNQRYFL